MNKPLYFACPDCGGNIGLEVEIKNIFGTIRPKLRPTKIEIGFASLVARNVKIIGKKFICLNCGKILSEENLSIKCPFSGDWDIVDKFVILRAIHKETGKKARPVLIHEKYADRYIKDAEESNHEVYKRSAKLVLSTEV
ncbi:MAG: hypothetical protein ACTSRS_22980 [Candidatus Helarchaeota archaeon]